MFKYCGWFIFAVVLFARNLHKCNCAKLRNQQRFISSNIGSIPNSVKLEGVTDTRSVHFYNGCVFTLFGSWVGTVAILY